MWIKTSLLPAIFALAQHAAALNLGGLGIKYQLMADMGMNPDEGRQLLSGTLQRRGTQWLRGRQSSNTTETIKPEFMQIPLNHFGDSASNQTFPNRFWVAESGYKAGGPIFIYDNGEADAAPGALLRLQNETSFFKQIVDEFGGIGIVWEHRFYGASVPVNISVDTPATDFEFLTAEQALADVVYFASHFSRDDIDADLTPTGTPWVFVGGSYPGMRAAFMRNFYPKTITASYASSAPVQASVDMSFYFEPLWQGMQHYGWGNCTADVRNAILAMDDIMEDPEAAADLKEKFLGVEARNITNAGMADALSTPFFLWQSFGVEGGSEGLRSFCDWLETDPKTNSTAPAAGFAPSRGNDSVIDRWSKWPFGVQAVNDNFDLNCKGQASNKTAPSCNIDVKSADPGFISWSWQYCTQWGFLQFANIGEHQLISKYNDLQHQLDICQRQFPDGNATGLLPAVPQADKTNAFFGGWKIRPSNVYWSGGQFDPWRTLSPLSSEPFAPDVDSEQDTPACNVATPESELFSFVMPEAEHAFDFRTTFPEGAVSRKFFTDALTEWLKCWEPGVAPEDPASIMDDQGRIGHDQKNTKPFQM